MARFPIYQTEQTISGRPSAVRASLDVSSGGTAIAEAVSGLGMAVSDLGEDFDILNAKRELTESNNYATDAEIKYRTFLKNNDKPETYLDTLNGLYKTFDKLAPKNKRAIPAYNQRINERKLSLYDDVQKLAVSKEKSNIQKSDFLALQQAKETGDFTRYKASVISGVKLGVYESDEAEKLLGAADKEKDNKEKNDTLGLALAKRNEEGILDVDKASEIINESIIIEPDEKIDLLNQISNQALREKAERDNQFNARMGDETQRIGTLLADNQLSDAEIDSVDLNAVGDQKIKEQEFKQKWKGILRDTLTRSEPLVSDESVYDNLTVGSELIERGSKSPAEWEAEFAEANSKGLLNREDRRTLRSKDVVATHTMQNRIFTQTTTDNRPALVQTRQGELAGLIEAREYALKSQDFKTADILNFNIKKAQVQEWNYGRYRSELRQQIADNPEWSQKQIFVASDILVNQYDKDLSVLLKEFDGNNPSDSIVSEPPDERLADIWNDLSQEDKAKVWEARMLGATVEEIIGEIE